jgi:hypothetical protein
MGLVMIEERGVSASRFKESRYRSLASRFLPVEGR